MAPFGAYVNAPCTTEPRLGTYPPGADPTDVSATASVRRTVRPPHRAMAETATLGPAVTPTTLRFKAQVAMRPKSPASRERAIRALNICVALVGLVVAGPLMAFVALLVKATSRGPVIYRQPRVGIDRRQVRGPE